MNEKMKAQTFRPAWKSFYWHMTGIVVCFIAIVVGVTRYTRFWRGITGFFFAAAAAAAVHMAFRRLSTALVVKPEEVTLEQGFVGRRSVEISSLNIRAIQVNQNFMQRLLNVGNLLIGSAATNDYAIAVKNLPSPYDIRDLIQTYVRAAENRETPKE